MFFESHHSTAMNYFQLTESKNDCGFPLHIHRAFECYAIISGSATAIVGGREYTLWPGDAVLVFPYQPHEYKTVADTSTWVCIFSPDLVGNFKNDGQLVPESNKFHLVPEDKAYPKNLLLKKAMCYKICGVFDENAVYLEKPSAEEDLLVHILTFVSKNYTSSCTLYDAARHVGYDYSYISKFFKRMTGKSFRSYVNILRISEACRLLEGGNLSVQAIAEASGFGCTRTFNREFLRLVEKTPRDYLKERTTN